MSITAATDKREVWQRIRGDPWTMQKMEIATDADAAKRILKHKNASAELTENTFFLSIFFAPGRRCESDTFAERVLEVDVLCPEEKSIFADEIMDQVTALLTAEGFSLGGGRCLRYDADTGDLAAPTDFYGVGTRYSFYTGAVASVKQIKTT